MPLASPPEVPTALEKPVPLRGICGPDECVGAFQWLWSDAMSVYVTGRVIEVNGGRAMP